MTGDADTCLVCRRGDPPVCDRCRTRMAEQMAALPALYGRLRVALVPGRGGGERVPSTKGEAPMPARLAALTLIAGGSDDARCLFVPAVRVWTTVDHDRKTWHREPVYDSRGRLVMTLVDDQTGVLPVREWLQAWAREWRRALGHSSGEIGPVRARRRNPGTVQPSALCAGCGRSDGFHRWWCTSSSPDDPVAAEWDARWPDAEWGPIAQRHHAYLSTWLPTACDQMPSIADFAASLRALTGAVRSALGDIEDLEYLGRCPEDMPDEPDHTPICGARIWHDPYASVITCPRCHTETGQERRIWLARRMLDAWPIDRRRRYPRGLIDVLRTPVCVTCSAPIAVEWVSATERADREPFWRPGTVACPRGCERAE
jgi:hypothetical protein